MAEHITHWQRTTKKNKNDILLVVDSSSLIRMSALIDPNDITAKKAPSDTSLLRFLEHVANLGVKIVIPEGAVLDNAFMCYVGRYEEEQIKLAQAGAID